MDLNSTFLTVVRMQSLCHMLFVITHLNLKNMRYSQDMKVSVLMKIMLVSLVLSASLLQLQKKALNHL
ncbi:hypothetical protein A9R12_17500 [Aeromonas hydrophila]|nr:hypothetical protein A9R12_17500 [Aeromonas hydrophila]